MSLTVADVDEAELLRRIFAVLAQHNNVQSDAIVLGAGDDSAVIAAPDRSFTVSTDVLVENQHFRTAWSTGYDVGWRAAMQNLADAAAMGARPTAIVAALVLPGATTVAWVEDFARGIAQASTCHNVAVAGGDLATGDAIVVSVTVFGDLEGEPAVTRKGARVGDAVAVAGQVGWSAAGFAALSAGVATSADQTTSADQAARAPAVTSAASRPGATTSADALDATIGRFRRPEPAITAGVQARSRATAMMDISDGLVCDAARIAQASSVVIDLVDPITSLAEDANVLGLVAEVLGLTQEQRTQQVRDWLLAGGEDHGMLATFSPEFVPDGFRVIGTVKAADTDNGVEPGVYLESQPYAGNSGWDHFRR